MSLALDRLRKLQERAPSSMKRVFDPFIKTAMAAAAPPPAAPPPPMQQNLAMDILSTVFPPLGIITKLPPGGEKVLATIPQAAAETIFPPISLLTGQLPIQTVWKAEQERQIDVVPEPFLSTPDQEKIKETLAEGYQAGKPYILGGGTTIVDVVTPLNLPDITIPPIKLPDFSNVGKYAIIAIAALGALYLAGQYMGRR